MTEDFDLSGRVALVVGAGESWLWALAASLLEAGAAVMAVKSGKTDTSSIKEMAKKSEGKLQVTDVATLDYITLSRVVEDGISRFGKIDILVNSLNVRFARPVLEVSDVEWERVMAVNLRGLFDACRAAGKHMIEKGYGKIINVTSCLGERGMANSSVYCAAAGGVLQLTRALALEWAKRGITVNAIELGWLLGQSETPDERITRFLPLRRYGTPDDFTPLVVYLASPASDYITGQAYRVDGGVMSRV
ncbi:MAG: SDR family oxidoreductase [Chloroflexi bacterium]|nr:SDR family oxidoreductase [Chloroflexota bacterium]